LIGKVIHFGGGKRGRFRCNSLGFRPLTCRFLGSGTAALIFFSL